MNPAARGLRSASELGAHRPHGTRLRYMSGCKCFRCRRANSDYEHQRQVARAAGDWNGIIDAKAAQSHLQRLSGQGVGLRSVVAATDIARSILHEIVNGERLRIRARTARKILAVTPEFARADWAKVCAANAWRLIDELIEEGFSRAAIARQLGYRTPALQFKRERITARTEQRVLALHRRLTT